MKRYIFLLLPLLAFMACNDDDDYSLDKFWIDIATVENPSESGNFYLTLDDGTKLWLAATNYPNYRPETGQRIFANYTILNDQPKGSSYDHDVKLNQAYSILTKDVAILEAGDVDNYGDDPVGYRDMWISGGFLNVRFYYTGGSRVHYVNLVKDETKDYTDGKIHLEFRHDNNDDTSSYRYNAMVCFDLQSLWDDMIINTDEVELVIHFLEYPDESKTYTLKYKFDDKYKDTKEVNEDDYEDVKDRNVQ